jgi:hypothetical protein
MPWRRMGEWRYSSTILDLGTRWRREVSFTPQPLYLRGNFPRYPLDGRLGGPQNRIIIIIIITTINGANSCSEHWGWRQEDVSISHQHTKQQQQAISAAGRLSPARHSDSVPAGSLIRHQLLPGCPLHSSYFDRNILQTHAILYTP